MQFVARVVFTTVIIFATHKVLGKVFDEKKEEKKEDATQ